MAVEKHGKLTFVLGTCAICGSEEVNAMHYKSKHKISIRARFTNTVRGEAGKSRPMTCNVKECRKRVDGCHEAVAHLFEVHPELIPVQDDGRVLRDAAVEAQDVLGNDETSPLYDLPKTVEIFEFLCAKRKEAEKELTDLRDYVKLLEDDNAIKNQRIADLEQKLKHLETEIKRLADTVRAINYENRQLKIGGRVTQEFREVHEEVYRGR